MYKKGRHEIVVRDHLKKVAIWIQKLKDVGDILVHYHSGHVSLPWAGSRFILPVLRASFNIKCVIE